MIPRSDHSDSSKPISGSAAGSGGGSRLNLLLSCASWRQNTAFDQIPPLLSPLGIQTIKAGSGEEAADVIRTVRVHIAVVDLAIPLQRQYEAPSSLSANRMSDEAGPRVLQLLRRLEAPPPTVVVRPAQPASRESARGLTVALREGAFAVLDQPVHLEAMLEVLRRILRRHYSDVWPA
jgi:CheY-like chemotaxis protein